VQDSAALGILGGSFNPPHVGHLIIAQEAWYRCRLGRVIFVPAGRNPLKPEAPDDQPADTRLSMLKLALGEDARFSIDQGELRHKGPSYSIDTLRRLRQLNPGAELHLIIGADSAMTLPHWKDVRDYAVLCRIVIAARPGSPGLSDGIAAALEPLGLRWEFMHSPLVDISSTGIRRRAREGWPLRYLVPDAVAQFIHKNALYKS
jgi:nicotinate-nucleotide adenylyltransferase